MRILIPPKLGTENCEYQFYAHGGCTVDYVGPYRPGPSLGKITIFGLEEDFKRRLCSGSCFPKEADKEEECIGWVYTSALII